tara:strand:+ start:193 stop:420 length:228 start_codon:yes stop_codon:yes gene_type:complete
MNLNRKEEVNRIICKLNDDEIDNFLSLLKKVKKECLSIDYTTVYQVLVTFKGNNKQSLVKLREISCERINKMKRI